MLLALTHDWAPEAFVVSFKLETDQSILIDKVRMRCAKERWPLASLHHMSY